MSPEVRQCLQQTPPEVQRAFFARYSDLEYRAAVKAGEQAACARPRDEVPPQFKIPKIEGSEDCSSPRGTRRGNRVVPERVQAAMLLGELHPDDPLWGPMGDGKNNNEYVLATGCLGYGCTPILSIENRSFCLVPAGGS